MDCGVYDFYKLPEECIAVIISFTSPSDASRFALISKIFQAAADSDAVWESFLPSDYKEIIARSDDSIGGSLTNSFNSLSKKQLYLRLADSPILIDGGTKSFSLDKSNGKKCFMLAARSLYIVWVNDERYWRWTSMQESSFQEVAELIIVWWLEIRGKIKTSMLSPNTTYAAYFIFKMADDFSGFGFPTVNVSVGITGEDTDKRLVSLGTQESHSRRRGLLQARQQSSRPRIGDERPVQRGDHWFEVKLGQFYILGDEDVDVEMALMEVDNFNGKSGLIVQGIEIRPEAI